MSRLIPVSWRNLVKRLQELDFEGPYAGGKHPQMRRGDVTVIIPNPHERKQTFRRKSLLLAMLEATLFEINPKSEWLGDYPKVAAKRRANSL